MRALPQGSALVDLAITHFHANVRRPGHAAVARGRCTTHFARRDPPQRSAVVRLHDEDGRELVRLYVTCASGALVWSIARAS